MAKLKPNLAAQMAEMKAQAEAPPAPPSEEGRGPLTGKPAKALGRSKSREGLHNIAGWFEPQVKFAVDELRLRRQRETGGRVTTQDLVAEALNDLFKKYGMPEVAPSKPDQ